MADKDDDRDDEDEKDEDEGEEESADEKSAGDKPSPAKAAAKKDADDEDDDEDDDEEEDAKPAAKPAAKPTAKPAAKGAKPGAKPVAKGSSTAARAAASAAARGARPRTAPPKQQGGSLGKSMLLFVVIIGVVAAGFALLGREDNAAPKWKVGETVDLEITLVSTDKTDLACAAADEIAGKHCGFEAQNKPWSKGDNTDDQKLLKPYTTVNGVQLLGAGMWSDAGLTGTTLPPVARFSAKCKYKVEGTVKKSSVQWKSGGPWYDRADELYTGAFSSCKVVAPSNQ